MKKKNLVLLLTIPFISACGTLNSYDEYEQPEEVVIELNENEFNIFEQINTSSFIKESNVEILNNKDIFPEEIGKSTYTLEYNFEGRKYKKDITYNIVDKTPPIFISSPSTITSKINDDLYPCSRLSFGDNYDTSPSCEIDGEYDVTKTGTYDVKYVIKDSSGNEATKDLKINIVREIKQTPTNSTPTRTYIEDIIREHKNENTLIGIDVSRWQGVIDYEKIKNAGVEFVMMRIGVQNNVEDEIAMDSFFKENIKKAKEANLKVGVYLYTSSINEKMAKEAAKFVIDALDGETLDLPVAFDWENWSKFSKYGISIYQLSKTYDVFSKELESHGYKTSLYSSKSYLERVWMNLDNKDIWLAHYTDKTNYAGNYSMWQLCSDGRVNGIYGDVDLDILYLNKKED